jgi:Streptomyces sporulation and cell division protein, SsgA
MIGALIRARLRARPVGEDGRLAYGGYMELLWDPAAPYEVRLAGLGPCAAEVVFARDLLVAAVAGQPAGRGAVRVRLAHLTGVRQSLLLLSVLAVDGPQQLALSSARVAAFLKDTTDLVPRREEWRYLDVDAGIAELLRGAA